MASHPRNSIARISTHASRSPPVSAAELQRLKKRFMKLDRDGSGTIDKDEFLLIPQIANNPLASRMIAIFDEECVCAAPMCPFRLEPELRAGRASTRPGAFRC